MGNAVQDAPRLGTRYRRLTWLGGGAQGSVWRADDQELGHPVAIKVLPPGEPPSEFATLRQLRHPGIVEVLDLGRTPDGGSWFSMAVATGRGFGRVGSPMPFPTWLPRVARLLEVLAFLHERGWVHGDLKPDHVLHRSHDAEVTLLDFGLTCAARDATGLRGTLGWIAPEVLGGDSPSARSDLYAAGVLAATALTGELPFPADSTRPGLGAGADAAVLGLPEDVPDDVARWLTDLLQRETALRPSSAREALARLEAIVGTTLGRPGEPEERLAPTALIAREDVLAEARAALQAGRPVALCGVRGSGRTALLDALHDELRASGTAVRALSFGENLASAQRALRALLAGAGHDPGAPPEADKDAAHSHGQELLAWQARLAQAAQATIPDNTRLLIDELEPDSAVGRTLIALAARNRGAVLVVEEEQLDPLVEQFATLGAPPPAVLRLPRFTPADTERWLGQALGPVADGAELADLLARHLGGLPGPLINALRMLLRDGLVFASERSWRWEALAVENSILGLLSSPTLRTVPHAGTLADEALERARGLLDLGEPVAARRVIDRALRAVQTSGLPALVVPLLNERARLHEVLGDPANAAVDFRHVRELATDDHAAAAALSKEASARLHASDYAGVLTLVEGAADLLRDFATPGDRSRARTARAHALLMTGRHEEVRAMAERTDLGPETALHDRIAWVVVLANCDWREGKADDAEGRARGALLRLPDDAPGGLRGTLLAALGTSLRLQGRMDDAADAYREAIGLLQASGRVLDEARLHNNLGIVEYLRGNWLLSIDAFERFLALLQRADNQAEEASARNNLGCLYRDTGQLARARGAFERALTLARKLKLLRLEPTVLGNLAECSAVRGDPRAAEMGYAEAIRQSNDRGYPDEAAEAWRRVAQMRFDRGSGYDQVAPAIEAGRKAAEAAGARGEMTLLDGLDALLRFRTGGAEQAGDEAEELANELDEAGNGLEAARMRLRLAENLVAADRPVDAEEVLDAAEPLFATLPARNELGRARRLKRHIEAAQRNQLDDLETRVDALQALALSLSRERDLEALLERVLDQALELLGEERGYALLLDHAGRPDLFTSRQLGRDRIEIDLHGPSSSVTRRVIATRTPLSVLDVLDDDSFAQAESIVAAGLRSIFCAPIQRADQLLGVLYVDSKTAASDAGERKLQLLSACADAASVAVENARLIDALQRKNQQIAVMAHELRTPLTAIVGFAQSLTGSSVEASPEVQELAHIIRKQGERLGTMVADVLELARMQAGGRQRAHQPLDPVAVLVQARDTVVPLASQAEVLLVPDADDELPDIVGDADRLVQVLVNLLGNAIKFSPPGGTIRLEARRRAGGGVSFRVSDEGPGIPAERLESVFEPWQQAGANAMRSKGVGLGLAIASEIVAEHNGTIRAENRGSGGARFTVELPPPPPLASMRATSMWGGKA